MTDTQRGIYDRVMLRLAPLTQGEPLEWRLSDENAKPLWFEGKRAYLAIQKDIKGASASRPNAELQEKRRLLLDDWDNNVLGPISKGVSSGAFNGWFTTWENELSQEDLEAMDTESDPTYGSKRKPKAPKAAARVTPGNVTTRRGAVAQSTLLGLLTTMFAQEKPFQDQFQMTRALYELLWDLSASERHELMSACKAASPTTNEQAAIDKRMMRLWMAEFFRRTFEVSVVVSGKIIRPDEIVFYGNYINPTSVSFGGQDHLFRFIDHFFDPSATHTGGVSSPLRLRAPKWDVIDAFNAALANNYRTGVRMPRDISLMSGLSSAAAAAEAPQQPASQLSSSSSSSSASAPKGRGKRAFKGAPIGAGGNDDPFSFDYDYDDDDGSSSAPDDDLVPIPFRLLLDAFEERELAGLGISNAMLGSAIYAARLRRHLEMWLVDAGRAAPTGQGETLMSEPDLAAENASLEALRAGYTKYQNAKAALLASIDTERAAGRLLMTDESYNRLYSNVASIELNFIGLYDAKASLMTYLKRQLTGSRPRSETSNHIVGVGDPGTGKTSLMQVVASMMVRLGLIESPTLQSYTSLGKTLENSLTGGETDRIAGTSLPADVPEALYSRLSAPSLFALRAASGDKTSPQPEPQVYDPGKFESPFEGGRVAQFLRGVFRTLGSSMIIDEAYGLSNARFRDIVDQLVALITQLKTQWSTVLLGYQEDMDEFFATGNIGLRRRYDTTIPFNSYSASELVAILILNTIRADNIVFAATEEQVLTVAAPPDPDDASVKDAVTSVMNDVYKKMGPYAMIHRSSQNRFGSDNAGAVEKLFGALGTAAITKFLGAPTLLLVTPDDVARQMENKVQFGRFTAEVRAERARALAARNQGGGGGGDDSSGR